MKKPTSKNKMTVDDLAIITVRQFDRVDEKIEARFDEFDNKIDTEISALRVEMIQGFANTDRKLEIKTSELDHKISKMDDKLDIVIYKLDSVIGIVKDRGYRLNRIEDQVLEMKTV